MTVTESTPQGSGMSPILFAIFIQALAEILDRRIEELEGIDSKMAGEMKKLREFHHYSLYADDVKLVSAIWEESDEEIAKETNEELADTGFESGDPGIMVHAGSPDLSIILPRGSVDSTSSGSTLWAVREGSDMFSPYSRMSTIGGTIVNIENEE